MTVVFVDTETTGLDVRQHHLWDIALIEEDGTEHQWHLDPGYLPDADPTAMRITRYYERIAQPGWQLSSERQAAEEIAYLTLGQHIVGAVPSFDANWLERLLRINGLIHAWHYHLVDVEALAAGRLGMRPPWDSDELAERLGVKLDGKHTAIGDARWAMAMYEAAFVRTGRLVGDQA